MFDSGFDDVIFPAVYAENESRKNFCIELGVLPDFFGTADNPIPIDESKL